MATPGFRVGKSNLSLCQEFRQMASVTLCTRAAPSLRPGFPPHRSPSAACPSTSCWAGARAWPRHSPVLPESKAFLPHLGAPPLLCGAGGPGSVLTLPLSTDGLQVALPLSLPGASSLGGSGCRSPLRTGSSTQAPPSRPRVSLPWRRLLWLLGTLFLHEFCALGLPQLTDLCEPVGPLVLKSV